MHIKTHRQCQKYQTATHIHNRTCTHKGTVTKAQSRGNTQSPNHARDVKRFTAKSVCYWYKSISSLISIYSPRCSVRLIIETKRLSAARECRLHGNIYTEPKITLNKVLCSLSHLRYEARYSKSATIRKTHKLCSVRLLATLKKRCIDSCIFSHSRATLLEYSHFYKCKKFKLSS